MAEQHGVRGYVLDSDGRPVAGATVVAYDKDLPSKRPRDERWLGEGRTGEDGAFTIDFAPALPSANGRGRTNLLARVLSGGRELPLVTVTADGQELDGTTVVFGAPPVTQLRLIVVTETEARLSAFETVLSRIGPLLGGVAVRNLGAEDIDFLSRSTGIKAEFIELARQSARLAAESGVPAEAFYGLGRVNQPLDLAQLAALDPATLRDGLSRAIMATSIPEDFAPRVDEAVRLLRGTAEDTVRISVRLRDGTTGEPLAHTVVRALDLDGRDSEGGSDMGTFLTDARGIARLQYSAAPGSAAHRIRLTPSPMAVPGSQAPAGMRKAPAAIVVTAVAESGPAPAGHVDGNGNPSTGRLSDGLPAPADWIRRLFPQTSPAGTAAPGPDPAENDPAVAEAPTVLAGTADLEEFTHEPAPEGSPQPDEAPHPHQLSVEIAPQADQGPSTVTVGAADRSLAASGVDVPDDLALYLYTSGLTTLSSLRRLDGGLRGQDDLPASAGQDAISSLEAHADLARVVTDGPTRTRLIELGYDTVASVADTPRTEFVNRAGDLLGDFKAARLHHAASAQTRFLNTVLAGQLANAALNGTPAPPENADAPGEPEAPPEPGAPAAPQSLPAEAEIRQGVRLPVRCTCNECSSALGPLAYLADLLHYATGHLRGNTGATVDAAALQTAYHQPFHELPVSCKAADQQVRTVRLVVESLRTLLRVTPPTPARQAELDEAEHGYRVAAYRSLLAQLGTSYEELRLAGSATEEDDPARAAFAERLGIHLTTPAPPEGDEIVRLCLALSPSATQGAMLTEAALEELFGLADTTRDALSGGAKFNDPNGQVRRWRLQNISWGRATSPDGSVYVTLSAVDGTSEVVAEVFSDKACTQRVASGRADGPNATIILVPAQGSGLYGTLTVEHTTDTPPGSPVEIVPVPRFTAWRLARLRDLWNTQDSAGTRHPGPAVEPDVVPLGYLADPVNGPAATLWQQRADALTARAAHLRQIIDTAPQPAGQPGFAALLQDAFGIPGNAIRDLARRRKEGEDVTADLAELFLTEAGLDKLAQVHTLVVAGETVDEPDWDAVLDILVRAWKRAQFTDWHTKETELGLTLSPDHFRLPELAAASVPATSRWRAEPTALADWTEVLTDRAGDETTATTAVAGAVDEAERETMPGLRDALVLACRPDTDTAPENVALAARGDLLSQQLFIDVHTSDCACTTRAAHAIEALQAMLLAARGDRFRAVPKLFLEAPQFDAEWKWIGSYATWRAAMFVQLWPENLLLPALHDPQTPAFAALLAQLGSRPATPELAKAAATGYGRYLEDVCSLELACSTSALTPLAGMGYKCVQFLFARSKKSGAVYWSLADPSGPSWFPQRYWQPVPTGESHVREVIGATPYQLQTGERYMYLFLKQSPGSFTGGPEMLSFVRMDLETHTWEPPKTLDLPDPQATRFTAVLVARAEVYPGTTPKAWNWSSAPQLFIRVADIIGNYTGYWMEREMGESGDAWEKEGFASIGLTANFEVHAAADQGNDALFTVFTFGSDLACALLASRGWPPRALVDGVRYNWVGMNVLPGEQFRGALPLIAPYSGTGFAVNELYILTRTSSGQAKASIFRRGADDSQWVVPLAEVSTTVPAAARILPNSGVLFGDKLGFQSWFGLVLDDQPDQQFYGRVTRPAPGAGITFDAPVAARPTFTGAFDFFAPQQAPALQVRRKILEGADQANTTVTNKGYIKEISYLVPTAIAQALARSGEYRAALDWFRLCYDYTGPEQDRKIAPLLREEEKLSGALPSHADGWLANPLAPHRIAATRQNCYTRFTVTAIAQCLRDLGNAEFTRDTAESLPRARVAYSDCLELMDAVGLGDFADTCEQFVANLKVSGEAPPAVRRAVELLRVDAAQIPDPAVLRATIDAVRRSLYGTSKAPWAERISRARDVIAVARARAADAPALGAVMADGSAAASAGLRAAMTLPGVESALERVARTAEAAFDHALFEITRTPVSKLSDPAMRVPWLRGSDGASPNGAASNGAGPEGTPQNAAGDSPRSEVPVTNGSPLKSLPLISGEAPPPDPSALGSPVSAGLAAVAADEPALAMDLLAPLEAAFVPQAPVTFCVPPNPALEALRISARLGLHKLRTCRNIAGMQRPVDTYAAPTDAVSGMPAVSGGTISTTFSSGRQPTQYRYSALIRRAKDLTAMAAQMESGMLHAMEAAESERFARFKAEQELAMAVANVRILDARVTEAGHDITLAEIQQRRAQVQSATYQGWLDAGLNQWEEATVNSYYAESSAQIIAAMLEAEIGGLMAFITASAATPLLATAAFTMATVTALSHVGLGAANAVAAKAHASGQVNSFYASIERRNDQWRLEKLVADEDMALGTAQYKRAQDHLHVAITEQSVAESVADQARDTLEFLSGEFLDAALYEWMSQQLESAYRFFLQQATATARLAQQQLAFERQEVPPVQLREDYWSPLAEPLAAAAADRRGLTGAARLSEDIQRLDDHAFATDRRRLQIRKTLSLASLYPLEFQRFRETGVFSFPTPMDLFDRDFPGHYMRLIRQVRTTVTALAPPADGIRATLSCLGLSRVVIGPQTGQTAVLQRAPESVALSSGFEASGVIELEPEKTELLLPFEGVGVDTRWELRMPKPANSCDYDTVTDVLFTVDFTALDSIDYRHQVIAALPALTWDKPFSVRDGFPDAWYDLHNPDQLPPDQRMVVNVRTQRGHFPPNLDDLKTEQVLVYFVRSEGFTQEIPVKGLHLATADGQSADGGAATTIGGLVSTRRGIWPAFAHLSPIGDWQLALPVTNQVTRWFEEDLIEDILLVITHSGQQADWPA
ncbi:Tc toxin subunit A-related protein [Streptomyces xanthophaeus]